MRTGVPVRRRMATSPWGASSIILPPTGTGKGAGVAPPAYGGGMKQLDDPIAIEPPAGADAETMLLCAAGYWRA